MSGFTFSEKQEEEIAGILAKYPFKKSAMLPLLTLVQRAERVISPEAMVAIGQKLDCSPAYVQSVLSFYTMYHTEKVGEAHGPILHQYQLPVKWLRQAAAVHGRQARYQGGGNNS